VSTIEELLGRKSSGSGLDSREYGRGDPLRCPRDILYPQTLVLTSVKNCGRSVGIARSWIKTTEFLVLFIVYIVYGEEKRASSSYSDVRAYVIIRNFLDYVFNIPVIPVPQGNSNILLVTQCLSVARNNVPWSVGLTDCSIGTTDKFN
jgi:hypothetical protein